MAKSAYPTNSDLVAFLNAAGFTPGTLDTATAIAAGIADFERRAGRTMLTGGTATRHFAPPVQGFLDLEEDLCEITSLQYQPEGSSPETLTAETDYWLLPYDAPSFGRPWLAVGFRRRWSLPLPSALHRAILVTGRWSYGLTMPDDAWLAMVQRGAALLAGQKGFSLSTGRIEAENAGVRDLWGKDRLFAERSAWNGYFEETARRYRRASL